MRSLRLPCIVAAIAAISSPLLAATGDAPAVDTTALLKELHHISEQQSTTSKQARQAALQQVNAAAASPERALALWEEAVRAVQFDGQAKEGAAFRDWKEKDGEALAGPLARNALRLYFMYLGLTIQRDGGMPVKDLLPQLINYTRELAADDAAADAIDDSIKHEKELNGAAANPRRPAQPQRKATDEQVRKAHDQVLHHSLASSVCAQWMKLGDFVNPEQWEKQPGNFDGIYTQVILPELRTEKDARILDYWDFRLKRDGEIATRSKLAFDIEKFNTQRRPALLWSRAQDVLAIGQKNRAIGDMIAIVRANPTNPDLPSWVASLETLLAPPAPASAADPAALPGSEPPAPAGVK